MKDENGQLSRLKQSSRWTYLLRRPVTTGECCHVQQLIAALNSTIQQECNYRRSKEHAPWYEVFLCLLVLGLAWVGAEVPVNLR